MDGNKIMFELKFLGPVVQSIVNLNKSIIKNSLSLLVKCTHIFIYLFTYLFAESIYAQQNLFTVCHQRLHFFFAYDAFENTVSLTKDMVSFE